MPIEVIPFHHVPSGTWSYLAVDPATAVAAVVDPVRDFDPASGRTGRAAADAILDTVRQRALQLEWVLETHAHADHLSAAPLLREATGARVGIGNGIRVVQSRFAQVFGLGPEFATDGSQFDHLFTHDERFMLGTLAARVIAVPGHTADSIAFLIDDALFVGDSLFMPDAGTARCDFPGGDATTLYRSIRRLFELPPETRVFVCHDYAPGGRELRCETSIAEQRRSNVHVRDGIDEETFVALRRARDATLAMPTLILPSIQVNIRAGALPPPDSNGVSYLRLPVDLL